MYNDTFSLRYTGRLNVSAVENAINEIVKRHEAWRTSFDMLENKVVQKVTANVKIALPFSDLRHLPLKQREARIAELAAQDSKQAFILTDAPLLRARLIQVADEDFRLTLVTHHLISDGVSVYQVFFSELQALYSAFAQGTEPNLLPLPFQYPDYAEWQRHAAAARNNDADLEFWDRQLEGELPDNEVAA